MPPVDDEGKEREQLTQIDLTACRDKYYNILHNLIFDPTRADQQYQDVLEKGMIDIDVRCKTRDQLPETVTGPLRPTLKVGQRRTYQQMLHG